MDTPLPVTAIGLAPPPTTFSTSPPPPPSNPDPRREKRGLLKKLENRMGIRSWATKFVIADEVKLRYFQSAHPPITEVPRKTLKTSQLIFGKMPVASKYFRPHTFQVEDSFNQYVATFACESDEERDDWLNFLSSLGRMRRLNTLIEQEIEQIKCETSYEEGSEETEAQPSPPQNASPSSLLPTNNVSAGATQQQLPKKTDFITRVYDLFVHEDVGKVETDDLGVLLLHLGKQDNDQYVKQVEKIVDPDSEGFVSKTLFVKWYLNLPPSRSSSPALVDNAVKRSSSNQTPSPTNPVRSTYQPTKFKASSPSPEELVDYEAQRLHLSEQKKLKLQQTAKKAERRKLQRSNSALLKIDVSATANILATNKHTNPPNPLIMKTLASIVNIFVEEKSKEEEPGGSTEDNSLWMLIPPIVKSLACSKVLLDKPNEYHPLALRLLRYCITKHEHVKTMFEEGNRGDTTYENCFSFFLAVCLEQPTENRYLSCRVQSAKLLLHAATFTPPEPNIPEYNIRSVVTVATSASNNNLRCCCLEILRLLLPTHTKAVARCNGVKGVMDAILDPSIRHMSAPLILSVLHTYSSPVTRKHLRPHRIDLLSILSAFTDLDAVNNAERSQRWDTSRGAVEITMKSFSGILLLASDASGLPSLMRLIEDGTAEKGVQIAVLDVVRAILKPCLQLPSVGGRSGWEGNNRNPGNRRATLTSPTGDNRSDKNLSSINILDNYAVILFSAFANCGLVTSLTNLSIQPNEEISSAALALLSDFVKVCTKLFPEKFCNELLLMPNLTKKANLLSEQGSKASTVLNKIAFALGESKKEVEYDLKKLGGVLGFLRSSNASIAIAREVNHNATRRERTMNDLKLAMVSLNQETGLDKIMLETQLKKSVVLKDKEPFNWDWMIIKEILEDSLGNTGILTELLKDKFVRRLGGFFRCDSGEKGYFAHLQWEPENIKFIHCASKFYQVLLSEEVGLKFLKEDRRGKIFEEVTKELGTTIGYIKSFQSSNPTKPSKLFNRITIQRTMTREYFAILGKIYAVGKSFLDKLGIFELIKTLSSYPQLDYLSRVILSNLDYGGEGGSSSQQLLKLSANSVCSNSLRMHIINILRVIMMSRTKDFEWGIEILATHLNYDEEVRLSALSVLHEAANYPPYLDVIVRLAQDCETLFPKFACHCDVGLKFLSSIEWMDSAIVEWRQEGMVRYVRTVEDKLAREFHRQLEKPTFIPLDCKFLGGGGGSKLDLESLLRLPWNIDVVSNEDTKAGEGNGDELTLDTFVDCVYAERVGEEEGLVRDENKVVIRGIYVNEVGLPSGYPCDHKNFFHSTLLLGACPVRKNGFISSPLSKWNQDQSSEWDISDERGSLVISPHMQHKTFGGLGEGGGSGGRAAPRASVWHGVGAAAGGAMFGGNDNDKNNHDFFDSCDWSSCSLGRECGSTLDEFNRIDDPNGVTFKIVVKNEPVVYHFSKVLPNSDEGGVKYGSNIVFLTKVEYTIGLCPEQSKLDLPTHLFGELAKTDDGVDLLVKHNVVRELRANVMKEQNLSAENIQYSDVMRGSLWGLAFIAASAPGLELIDRIYPEFVSWCARQAYESPDFSLRGTCALLLGLISASEEGRGIINNLEGCNWDVLDDDNKNVCGVCVPSNLKSFFRVAEVGEEEGRKGGKPAEISCLKRVGAGVSVGGGSGGGEKRGGTDGAGGDIKSQCTLVINTLSKCVDSITQKEAMSTLQKMKNNREFAAVWSEQKLFKDVACAMMEGYSMESEVRKFIIFELFA